jgi:hypothetical protein
LPRGVGAFYCERIPLIKVTGTHHGNEEKRKISLRESQVLLRNRRGKRIIGCRQRAQSSLRMWAGYETDVLKEFSARVGLVVDFGGNTRSFHNNRNCTIEVRTVARLRRNEKD